MTDHASNAREFNKDHEMVSWHNESLWYVRQKRDRARDEVSNWELLRDKASEIKLHTLDNLRNYLIDFEKNALQNGWHVHWASDAGRHNRIVLDILKQKGLNRVVKSKSMLTEECGLNDYLEDHGISIIDTDLGERIVQLARKPPSHIVLPAIHLRKKEIGSLFQEHLDADPDSEDPLYLTRLARKSLRNYLQQASAAISGVNFGLAGEGAVVVCTNEGNADMGIHHADTYIASMGIEKLIPGMGDLPVFLELLARSATGQPVTTYTSHLKKPPEGKSWHIVLVDNGRTEILARHKYREILKCIRCGACINTCPVYRRSGGYSYGYTIPGPVGSVLAPLHDIKEHRSLPYASSLCGSCTDVCPVKIDLHEMLFRLRADVAGKVHLPLGKRWMLFLLDQILYRRSLYNLIGSAGRILLKYMPAAFVKNRFIVWTRSREIPEFPKERFRDWYKRNHTS